jgi:hypothetical protein
MSTRGMNLKRPLSARDPVVSRLDMAKGDAAWGVSIVAKIHKDEAYTAPRVRAWLTDEQ